MKITWYKSKTDVYMARIIWFLVGIMSIYIYYIDNTKFRYFFLIEAIGAFLLSVIAGRRSFNIVRSPPPSGGGSIEKRHNT